MESLKRCPSDALDMLQKFLNEDREGDEGDELVGEEKIEGGRGADEDRPSIELEGKGVLKNVLKEENDENVLPFREEIRNELNDAKKEYRKVLKEM
ncbi:9160_t:CDS:2, partial [Entrophospora sp. SA101]